MLSLPLIPPQPDTLPHRSHYYPRSTSPPPSQTNARQHQQQRHNQQQHRRDEEKKTQNAARSPLALLAADEAAIAHRKAAIRNFGAYWIRPPGIGKTLQAMTEEAAEMAEQEELLRQEQGLRDLQAQQQLDEARTRADEMGEEGEGAEEERDLDAEIPDADAEEEVTFNEESMVEGSRFVDQEQMQMEEAELTGAARDEEDLGIEHEERDLDDSVPEAGSYQHTDTEAEDSSTSSDSDLDDSFSATRASSNRQQPNTRSSNRSRQHALPMEHFAGATAMGGAPPLGLHERMRAQAAAASGDAALARSPGSLNLSSSLLESSFVGSSPVMQRGRGRGGGARGRGG
ncbi:hypothetical protein LTR37_018206 [Vermiconidia calcicola]|uniref:Uncharacterized protein n=1 Tax=Vermiconidia calcicola TaxID=1690605 RepID=A0ACC3MJ36_9PEZI|nr:hypothetical protein LTR37_018206 [Vermiconidia calcicola]